MKRLRAASALLFQLLLLLQVGMIGSGMACAPDAGSTMRGPWAQAARGSAGGPVAGGAAAHGGGAHAGHGMAAAPVPQGVVRGGSSAGGAGQPARGPATPDHHGMPSHCATAAGCAAVAAEAPRLVVASVSAGAGAVHAGRVSLPRSTHPAPEPPPPRA